MRSLALILALGLSACASRPAVILPPKVVQVPVIQLAPVPAPLTEPCDTVPKRANTVSEAARLANARLASIQECNKRLRQIRELVPNQ
jgi:hypothetical protein